MHILVTLPTVSVLMSNSYYPLCDAMYVLLKFIEYKSGEMIKVSCYIYEYWYVTFESTDKPRTRVWSTDNTVHFDCR